MAKQYTENSEAFEVSLGELLLRSGRLMRQRLVEELQKEGHDFPEEFFPTMKFVYRHSGAHQDEIAGFLLRDKATAARLLTRMEQAGLIERRADINNRRRKLVFLTQQGEATFKKLTCHAQKLRQLAVENIPPSEVEICKRVLSRVFSNLNNSL